MRSSRRGYYDLVVLGHCIQEGLGFGWGSDASGQQKAEGNHAPIKRARVILMLLDHGPVQANAGKQTAGTRVGEDLSAHGDIGHALGEAPDRAGRG